MEKITSDKIILGEGKDECAFFDALLSHMQINNVQTLDMGGRTKFASQVRTLRQTPGFSGVRRIAVTRDAEENHDATFASVANALANCELPVPKAVGEYATHSGITLGVFIFPGRARNGMLENLCLETVAEHPVTPCVNAFFELLSQSLPKRGTNAVENTAGTHYYPANEPKAKAQAFLSGMHELVNSVGLGAKKRYWNFDHSALEDLRNFLGGLV